MPQTRSIIHISRSQATLEGAGVRLRRAFGFGDTQLFDPFLLLDDFRGDDPAHYTKGFPWHPHRGIETITYVLAGQVAHGDSLGNSGVIGPGDVQWMTAGNGIIHQEMPAGDAQGRMYGFQLWANLPAANKMMEPRYRDVKAADIPAVTLDSGALVRVICGQVAGVRGPAPDIVIEPQYLDVTVPPGATFTHAIPPGHTVFAYIFEGEGLFGVEDVGRVSDPTEKAQILGNQVLVVFGDGEQVQVEGAERGVRFLMVSGQPLRQPVAWRGPIVMNTQEELQVAMRELREGTFIKHQR
jgi:redox-sensitive bicupin YhaK (pirin superfamily)